MKVLIETESDAEYKRLSRIVLEEDTEADVTHAPSDGHYHHGPGYDLAVISVDGAKGMEAVIPVRERYSRTMLIWITNDKYFAHMAMRKKVFEFLVRPYADDEFRVAVKKFLRGDVELWKQNPMAQEYYFVPDDPPPFVAGSYLYL